MNKILLILLFVVSAFISRAQTTALEIADKYFEQKEYSKASDYYDKVLKAEPENVKALRRMGFCIMNFKGQELDATQFFNRALKIEPKDPVSTYYLGVIFSDKARESKTPKEKADFKAQAAKFLNLASQYGSDAAQSAINNLNTI